MAFLNLIGALQLSCEALNLNFVGKPEKPVFRDFLATNVTFFQIDLPFLVLAHLYSQMDSYVVILSAIGATNQICKAFLCKFVENTRKKNRILEAFWHQT